MTHLIADTKIGRRVQKIIGPTIKQLGFEIVRVQYLNREKAKLQIMIDKKNGMIEVSDCAKASNQISALLDVADPIRSEYELEVSSPGINRPLTRLKDFEVWKGYNIKITTFEKIGASKNFRGKLIGVRGSEVIVDISDQTIGLEFEWIQKASLSVSFEEMASVSTVSASEADRLNVCADINIEN
ncbi:MAG: ribosome maturation factor RimP [Pseudomonadota bacterium]|nr:ribosome maturation factor RimP [Pseudomonadota bacterium]